MERKRIVHTLDTPYSTVEWPSITPQSQQTILDLLCHLLTPLANHRNSLPPSKGKRKRSNPPPSQSTPPPPPPPIKPYIDIGLPLIHRTLQSTPSAYIALFIPKTGQSPIFNCLFPSMIGSLSPEVRLVGFDMKEAAERLSEAAGIPRVSCVGIKKDAPEFLVKGLVEFIQENVKEVEVKWLKEVERGEFLETRIKGVVTMVGKGKEKKKEGK
ncbi:hypothetical protein QBC38DRAFT_477073 [Podospora fimiseda]|uniref:Uncharacterized protein n=1 Tax=Podospora fimiseda TaxID=252190 RepID=A0AAN7GZA8_9PEZI|nr:hypothetical protein QBC38DRAFT_477073 [Podospora fimiseda]